MQVPGGQVSGTSSPATSATGRKGDCSWRRLGKMLWHVTFWNVWLCPCPQRGLDLGVVRSTAQQTSSARAAQESPLISGGPPCTELDMLRAPLVCFVALGFGWHLARPAVPLRGGGWRALTLCLSVHPTNGFAEHLLSGRQCLKCERIRLWAIQTRPCFPDA